MDYDDDEFQGQNRQLAREGCSKVCSVLHPYALPKFDFDNTLHGHLKFTSLGEDEGFLGQEDSQWIEEYSRRSSEIEFNSSGVELRRNNVWSEATSSESVEMLLKSVGQEEKVVGKVIIEQLQSHIRDERLSMPKAMDPNLNKESKISGEELDPVVTNEEHNISVLGKKVDNAFDHVLIEEREKDHMGYSEKVGASVEESVATGLSKNVSSGAAEESFQNKESSTNVPMDNETMIVETCTYTVKESSFVQNVEYVDDPSAVTSNPFSEKPSAEHSTLLSKNQSTETSIAFSENPSTETGILSGENPSTETHILYRENLSAETSIPLNENPQTEISILSSENLLSEPAIPLSGSQPAETSIVSSQDPPTVTSILFSGNPSTETSIPFSENLSTETGIPFSENLQAENRIPFSESLPQLLKLRDSDSSMSNAGSLSNISPVKTSSFEENKISIEKDAQQTNSGMLMVFSGNFPETGCESSGAMQVDCKVISSEPGAIHLGQDDSLNGNNGSSLPLESNDMDTKVFQDVDRQKNVKPSLLLEGRNENTTVHDCELDSSTRVEQVTVSDHRSSPATAENVEQPRSPIFGVSLVHQGSKEITEVCRPTEGNSPNEFSQFESAVASVSNSPSTSVEKESSADVPEIAIHDTDARCVTPVESFDASQTEQEPMSKNSSPDFFRKMVSTPSESSGKTGNNSQTRTPQDPKESAIEEVNESNDVESKVRSVSLGNVTLEDKNITFEATKRADVGQDDKGSLSYATFQVSNLPKVTEVIPEDSSSSQMDPKKLYEVSVGPQNPSGVASQTGVKGKAERKPRRKSAGKESARKATAAAGKDSVRGIISPVLLTPAATGQANRFEEVKSHENVAKPEVVLSSPKIPDLNNSVSIIQPPFTDNQQVQLRAQILVYGSLISGSPPDETHMIAAFGQSDSGRTWEGVWHACLERFHVQKSQPKPTTPVQSQSDMSGAGGISDQIAKHASIQHKIPSSPLGGSNKGAPPFVSPMIPFSSPLWNITTPDNLQSSSMTKPPRFEYHQTPSPLRPPYQTPPVQNYLSSWLSQGPFSGQWLAGSPIPAFNPTAPCFPSLPITEPVKLTPIKESGGLVIKHTSHPTVLNSTPIIVPERSTVSSDQPSSVSKSRKRNKGIPAVGIPCSTSAAVSITAHLTKSGNQNVGKVVSSEESLNKVEESKVQAKEASAHADNAMFHCHGVWNQIGRRYTHDLNSNDEAKWVSSAVSLAAAASVAKAAAAAAKIASDVAEQARLMFSSLGECQSFDQSKAASASSKHVVNLDAIVKAAELASEAVSQAGKIVAMSEPFSLKDLVEAGPAGYWKTPRLASNQQALIAEDLNAIKKRNVETAPDKAILPTSSGGDLAENPKMEVDGTLVSFTGHGKDKRKPRARKASEVFRTVGAMSESKIGSVATSIAGQTEPEVLSVDFKEIDIKEGCLVEVYKDNDKHNGSWFGANVLSIKDRKALVSYTDIQSDEGSEKYQEWLPLKVEGSEAPKIRLAHPLTTMQGTKKRCRTVATDFMWSSGDRVDVWTQNCWREGVVLETNKIDTTSLTVQFPAQGETSVVRSWFVRPTLVWNDGKWIMCDTSAKHFSSPGNKPQEKRLKLGSPIVESQSKPESSQNVDLVDLSKQEESRLLSLSTHQRVFDAGSTKDNKVNTHRSMRSGLKKEGPGVIFGVPKPGKTQKFMDVSKHYVVGGSNSTTNDSIKFTRYLIPHPPGSRGCKNSTRSGPKEKRAAETKPPIVKSRKPPVPSFRTISSNSTVNKSGLDSVSDGENQSGQMEQGSSFGIEDKPERLNKRKFIAATDESQTKVGKSTPEVTTKVEKSTPEVTETRRSNRKIQPTSRLLEGLQSSMTISKMPALAHSAQRSHNKVTPKGSKNNGRKEEASKNS